LKTLKISLAPVIRTDHSEEIAVKLENLECSEGQDPDLANATFGLE